MVLHLAHRLDQAMEEARAGLELDPNYHLFHRDLGLPLVSRGRYEEGVAALRRGVTLSPGDLFPRAYLGWALGLAGQSREALTILEDLERRRSEEYVGGVFLAVVCVGLGDYDQAISWLQQGAEERDSLMTTSTPTLSSTPSAPTPASKPS